MAELVFDAIGTRWAIRTEQALSRRVVADIAERVESFDVAHSRFRTDSLVSDFARTGAPQLFPDDSEPLLAFYRQLYCVTGGAVSPLVGGALEHLGYDRDYRLTRRPGAARVPDWDEVLTVEGTLLTAREPVVLDFGAAGKGYLIDLLARILTENGYRDFLVDGSGDLVHRGPRPCRVGLEHPDDPRQVIGVVELRDGALCASATNRRSWGRDLHHIIDPGTGEPTVGVAATWVTANSAMVADGLSTALFLTDPAVLAAHFEFNFVQVLNSGEVRYSTDFDGELFS